MFFHKAFRSEGPTLCSRQCQSFSLLSIIPFLGIQRIISVTEECVLFEDELQRGDQTLTLLARCCMH